MLVKSQLYTTLVNVGIIIPASFLAAMLTEKVGFSNNGTAYVFGVGITVGIVLVIDLITTSLFQAYARFQAAQTLKKLGYKSVEDAVKDIAESSKYLQSLQALPYEVQQEVVDKAKRTKELIQDYESRPEFYFQNMNMTKQEAIKQVQSDFNNWMKQKGLPTWTPRNMQ